MGDSFTEVSHQSWFSRIGSAIKGIFFGLIIFVIAFPLLFWNEGRAVRRQKTLEEGSGLVMSVSADRVDPANDGKLIHVTGTADTTETLKDPVFGVSANALKIRRDVEMYQWEEKEKKNTRKKIGGGTTTTTTYSYSKTWSSSVIHSSNFKQAGDHQNPGNMPYASETWTANPVTLDAYTLSSSLLGKINTYTSLAVDADTSAPAGMQKVGDIFYRGENPASPEIGDIRVTFQKVPATPVSIVAKQVQNTFEPYTSKNGGKLELLEIGTFSAEAMFTQAQADNRTMTWLIRGGGFLLMWIGLGMMLKLLSVLADVLPFLGNIIGAGTSLIAGLVAAVLSLITVAVAWVVYRPLLGVALLAAALAIVFVVRSKLKKATPPPHTVSAG